MTEEQLQKFKIRVPAYVKEIWMSERNFGFFNACKVGGVFTPEFQPTMRGRGRKRPMVYPLEEANRPKPMVIDEKIGVPIDYSNRQLTDTERKQFWEEFEEAALFLQMKGYFSKQGARLVEADLHNFQKLFPKAAVFLVSRGIPL
jgi:hypothetical protein